LFTVDGILKVTDFGITKILERSVATASAVLGTPLYMAPEQWTAGRLRPASDLYSLAAVLYQLLAGRPVFNPQLPAVALMHRHLNVSPAPLDGVPGLLAEIVLRTLAKDPADRPASAHILAAELARAAVRSLITSPGHVAVPGRVTAR
jgi:serine/threonine-protein kinase